MKIKQAWFVLAVSLMLCLAVPGAMARGQGRGQGMQDDGEEIKGSGKKGAMHGKKRGEAKGSGQKERPVEVPQTPPVYRHH